MDFIKKKTNDKCYTVQEARKKLIKLLIPCFG